MSRILYDAAGCWKCDDVRQVLDRLGLAYESVEVRGNPEARARMIELTGERYVPVLVDGDLAIWDRRRIIRHLLDAYADGADDALAEEVPPWAGGTRRVSPPPPPRPAPRTPGRR